MAIVAAQGITRTGITPAYAAAAAGGDEFAAGERTFLHIKNAGTAVITATLVTPGTVDGLAVADQVVNVPVGDVMVGPIGKVLFENRPTGRANVTWSAVTSVTFAVLSI